MKKNVYKFSSLIDLHSHVLPEMDDGSISFEMSYRMLTAAAEQGVRCIAATPHFYPTRDYPRHFLEKRQKRLETLRKISDPKLPLVLPGAEVRYFDGITEMEELPKLRIGRSKALLIEMPFGEWSSRMTEDILELNRRQEYCVILAHIERYLGFGNEKAIERLASENVLFQANAEFFNGFFSSRRAVKMVDFGRIHFLGSDCHNLTTRPPNLADACAVIASMLGKETVDRIMKQSIKVLLSEDHPSDGGKHERGL